MHTQTTHITRVLSCALPVDVMDPLKIPFPSYTKPYSNLLIFYQQEFGKTPLHIVAQNSDEGLEMVKLLLLQSPNIDINLRDMVNLILLLCCCLLSSSSSLLLLLLLLQLLLLFETTTATATTPAHNCNCNRNHNHNHNQTTTTTTTAAATTTAQQLYLRATPSLWFVFVI